MNRIGKFALAVILAHLGIAVLHGGAHKRLLIGLSANQQFFVWAVIIAAPLLAALLLLVNFRRAGGLFLFSSMAGSLVFGAWNHFLVRSADNIASIPPTGWGMAFRVTAIFLFFIEVIGCAMGISLLR
jgi:hypothetical protein